MRNQLTALAVTAILAAPAAEATTYTIETIDYPGAASTSLSAINDLGRIVGAYTAVGATVATGFTERNGVYTSIPFTLPCRSNGRCRTSFLALNDLGTAAGSFSPDVDYPGLFVQKLGSDPVIVQPPGYPTTSVQFAGLNDRGVLAGWYQDLSVDTVPTNIFEVVNGTFQIISLPVPGVTSATAYGLNNWNQLIGVYTTDTETQPFLLTGQHLQRLNLPAAWNGTDLFPMAINDFGAIIGSYGATVDGADFATTHSFLLQFGIWQKIDFPGAAQTTVTGINNRGEIFGTYNTVPGGTIATSHQFVLVSGVYTDLTPVLPAGYLVIGIDNRGRLFGSYPVDPTCTASCALHGFIATPVAD